MNDTHPRIQKLLAHLGYGARRTIESWIRAGRITLNNQPATLGARIDLKRDRLCIDNKKVLLPQDCWTNPQLLLYNKPVGEICSHVDPCGRPTIFDTLPRLKKGRWVYIGRLDLNTSGLLLVTNDGHIAHRFMHSSYRIEREYAVRTLGQLTPSSIKQLTQGVRLDDGDARIEHLIEKQSRGVNHWYQVVVMEGRNRLVRRLFESQGVRVSRLMRLRFGQISLPANLYRGKYQRLPIDSQPVQAMLNPQ